GNGSGLTDTLNCQGFIHLRVRSAYSLPEGAIKSGKFSPLTAATGIPAEGADERAKLFGALEISETPRGAGGQLISRTAIPVTGIGGKISERWAKTPTVVLAVQNEAGWLNLCALSSSAFLDAGSMDEPSVPWSMVAERSEGLILLSGGPDGPVDPLFVQG